LYTGAIVHPHTIVSQVSLPCGLWRGGALPAARCQARKPADMSSGGSPPAPRCPKRRCEWVSRLRTQPWVSRLHTQPLVDGEHGANLMSAPVAHLVARRAADPLVRIVGGGRRPPEVDGQAEGRPTTAAAAAAY
jgi:hypothetical protein